MYCTVLSPTNREIKSVMSTNNVAPPQVGQAVGRCGGGSVRVLTGKPMLVLWILSAASVDVTTRNSRLCHIPFIKLLVVCDFKEIIITGRIFRKSFK